VPEFAQFTRAQAKAGSARLSFISSLAPAMEFANLSAALSHHLLGMALASLLHGPEVGNPDIFYDRGVASANFLRGDV
jgi:hypothetical protein